MIHSLASLQALRGVCRVRVLAAEIVQILCFFFQSQISPNRSMAAQFYVGRTSHFRSVMPLGSSDKQMVRTLMDEIRKYGSMNRLVSDNARAQISARVKEILCTFCIADGQSEPYKGIQNFAERAWKDSKTRTNNLLNMSGAPPELWLLTCATSKITLRSQVWETGHPPNGY